MGMTANAIRAGRAYVELFLNKDKMLADLAHTGAAMAKFGKMSAKVAKSVVLAAGAITVPLLAAAKVFAGLGKDKDLAHQMGFTKEEVATAARLATVMDEVVFAGKRVAAALGLAVAPVIEAMGRKAIAAATASVKWIDANHGLIVSLFQIGKQVLKVAVTVALAGKVLASVGMGLKFLATLLGLLLSPTFLVIAAIGALVYILDQTTDAFKDVKAFAGDVFGGIADALKAGDIEAAQKIMIAAIQLEWLKFKLFMNGLWDEIVTKAGEAWDALKGHGVKAAQAVGAGFNKVMAAVRNGLAAVRANPLAILTAGISVADARRAISGAVEGILSAVAAPVARPDLRAAELRTEIDDARYALDEAILEARYAAENAAATTARTLALPTAAGTSAGTFSAYAAQGLGVGNKVAENTERNTRQTVEELRGLRTAVANVEPGAFS